jgi:disulfide bond formation protein DsbB
MAQTSCPFSKLTVMPRAALLIFAAAVGALLFVFTMQYGFGVQPCILCLWQRVPYGVVALLSLIAVLWRPYGRHSTVLLGLCALTFTVGAGLALFHTGVELHWWLGTSGCSIQPLHGPANEDLRTQLLHTAVAHCDEISWTFLGLSMANWNVGASLILAIFAGTATRCRKNAS